MASLKEAGRDPARREVFMISIMSGRSSGSTWKRREVGTRQDMKDMIVKMLAVSSLWQAQVQLAENQQKEDLADMTYSGFKCMHINTHACMHAHAHV